MSISFINRKSGGGGGDGDGSLLNVFTQLTEPSIKQGIWLKKDNTKYKKITAVDNLVSEPSWLPDGSITDIPYKFNGSAVAIGTDVYLLGGGTPNGSIEHNNYKYDTLTDTYTKMTDIPEYFTPSMYGQFAIAIGTDIYIFCTSTAYKYDTLTDTYTQITSIPLASTGVTAGVVGTNIYVFSGYQTMYKYDTLTNTYTSITLTNYAFFTRGSVITIGTDLYVFQTSSDLYKYDTLTDTITKLSNQSAFNVEAIGTDIYLFDKVKDENNNYYTATYKYDITTDTYTQLTNIYNYDYVCDTTNISVVIGTKIYLFGGSTDDDSKVAVLQTSMSFDDKSIVLLNGNTYKTQLFTNDIVDSSVKYPFNDVFYYTTQDGLDGTMPVYYGDGTQWINIKNPPEPEPTEIQTYYEIEYD